MDHYRKITVPTGKKRNPYQPRMLAGGFRSYVSPRGNINAPSFGSLPQNQSLNYGDLPNFKSQSYENFDH
jgi:hypothetical protein